MLTANFGSIFQARYSKGDAYITVWALGREIDVINISHIEGDTLTREQFRAEVADSKDYIIGAYDVRDILMQPASA